MALQRSVSHRFDPEGDGVILVLRREHDVVHRVVTASEAKQLAWGILADLDPDGPDEGPSPYATASAGRRRSEAPRRMAILLALAEGPCGRHDLSKRTRLTVTAWDLSDLQARGLALRIDGGPERRPAVYAITQVGEALVGQAA